MLFDYNAFWVEDLYDYVLYTGDLALAAQVWPNLVELIDGWYPAQMGADGLLVNSLGPSDYGFIPRAGTTVAYYNAGYVLALRQAAQLAAWIGQDAQAAAWTGRIAPIAAVFSGAFWDARAGAFVDATSGPVVHPEDATAFAVLAGLATPSRGREALDYLSWHDSQPYGAAIADNDTWDGYPWGSGASQRVYPFMSYFEVLARYAVGFDASALALIRREWGTMLENGPKSTMWETIGPGGKAPVGENPSWDHGWSSGAAPALTNEVLGVTPATPGFASFSAAPHPSDLAWARGAVPTPHGSIELAWSHSGKMFTVKVDSPVSGTITLPLAGTVVRDGRTVGSRPAGALVPVSAGVHTVAVVTRRTARPRRDRAGANRGLRLKEEPSSSRGVRPSGASASRLARQPAMRSPRSRSRTAMLRALPLSSYAEPTSTKPRRNGAIAGLDVMGREGFEPSTLGLRVPCSTN